MATSASSKRTSTLALLGVLIAGVLMAPGVAHATPLSFVYHSSLESGDANQPVYQQDFANRSVTQLGAFGEHLMWWSANRRYAVSAAARYDEAYIWLNASVYDTQTNTRRALTDTNGAALPQVAGWVSFGGFSADGSRFALIETSDPDLSDGGWSGARVMVFSSATGKALASTGCGMNSACAISPDGSRVVYSYGGDSANSLWMLTVSPWSDTSWMDSVALDTSSEGRVTPFWPKNGSEIVVNIEDALSRRHVHIAMVNPATKSIRYVPSHAGEIYDVTPDGAFALIASQPANQPIGYYEMARLNLATGGYVPTLSVSQMLAYASGVVRATISPDGSRVLFEAWHARDSRPGANHYPADIYRCTFAGTGLARVALNARCPAFVAGDVTPVVATSLTAPKASVKAPKKGQRIRLSAKVTPANALSSAAPKISVYHLEKKRVKKSGRWVSVTYWRLRTSKYSGKDASGRFWLDYTLPARGKWKARASYFGSINALACKSPYASFTVK